MQFERSGWTPRQCTRRYESSMSLSAPVGAIDSAMLTLTCRIVKTVSNLLRDIDELLQVNGLSTEHHDQLLQVSKACGESLNRCNTLADKCSVGDSSLGNRVRLMWAWHRLQADPDDVRKLRSLLNSCVSDLNELRRPSKGVNERSTACASQSCTDLVFEASTFPLSAKRCKVCASVVHSA